MKLSSNTSNNSSRTRIRTFGWKGSKRNGQLPLTKDFQSGTPKPPPCRRWSFTSTAEEYVENGGIAATEEMKEAQANFYTWAEWRSPRKGEEIDYGFTALRRLGIQLSGKRKEELRRFLNSISHWNQDSTILQQEVIRCCFIPQLVTSGQEQILDDLGRANTEWAILPTTIEKVRNCLR